jgi:hypothetical protein
LQNEKSIVYLLCVFFLEFNLFGFHKFYVAVYQINFAPEKEMLQITSRVFADDLNKALENTIRSIIGTAKESPEDLVLLKKILRKT